MDVLQKKIDNSDNLSLFEYNNILKLCADFYEMKAMVYIYDKILENNIKLLHLMAEQLLEHETIDESDIKVMMSGKKISRK